MRRRNTNFRRAPKRHKRIAIKILAGCVVIILALYAAGTYLKRYLKASDYFKIQSVVSREAHTFDFSYLKGRNMFDIDLKKESRYVLKFYPLYKRIRFVRILPNRLLVDFVKREPIALVKLYKYFYVDEESVLFDAPDNIEARSVPIVMGLETKLFGPKSGKIYDVKALNLAMEIIREFNRRSTLKGFVIDKIDVRDIAHASLIVVPSQAASGEGPLSALEIKIGEDRIKEKISIISGLLNQAKSALANIKYIDVRFKEPVIKLK